MARFWAKFGDDRVDLTSLSFAKQLQNQRPCGLILICFLMQVLTSIRSVLTKQGKEQEEAMVPAMENLRFWEEELKGKKFFGGEKIGFVDLALGWLDNSISILEEIVGLKIVDEKFPLLSAWMQDFADASIIKDNWPPRDKMIVKFQALLDAAAIAHQQRHDPNEALGFIE